MSTKPDPDATQAAPDPIRRASADAATALGVDRYVPDATLETFDDVAT